MVMPLKNSIQENFLKLVTEHFPDMLWVKDTEGRYLYANRAICEKLLMTDTEEVLGKTDVFFAKREREKHPENAEWHTFGELCLNSDEIVLQFEETMAFEEYGNIRGEHTYLEVHKAPLYDANKKLIGTIGSGRNITAQKKAERAIVAMNHLANTGPVVLFEWSPTEGWPIKNVSRNVLQLLDISYEEIEETHPLFATFVHPEDLEKLGREVAEYFARRATSFSQDYRIIKRNKEVIWVRDFTVVEYEGSGEVAAIKGYLLDNTAKIMAHEEVKRLSYTDILTTLPNRQKIQQDLTKKEVCGCIVFNVDKFREINDLFGVKAADGILKQIAQWFSSMHLDAYRIGGDEFALLLYESATFDQLTLRISDWLTHFAATSFFIAQEPIPVHMTVGVALGGTKLLTHADIALHEAKEKRLSYAFYKEEANVEEIYRTNIAMAKNIHQALLEDRFICHYQPIVDFQTKEIRKYETLVRLVNEDGSIVAPIHFLPIAKKTKLYAQITRAVVRQACETFKNRSEEFSINLSIDDIEDTTTIQIIINTLLKTQTASRVIFEILESEGIQNYGAVELFIAQMKSLGAKIAIDDFGSGYSNFEHILRLDIDYIKIDGALVRDIAIKKNNDIIIETIVDFAHKIGAKVVAEYVSDENIYEIVKKMGVEYAQGYFTGKPDAL